MGNRVGARSAYDLAVGQRLRGRRKLRNLTTKKLAALTGVKFWQLSKYEHGRQRMSGEPLIAIAKALGVSPGYFLDGIGAVEEAGEPDPGALAEREIREFLATRRGVKLAQIFMSIQSDKLRARAVAAVNLLAEMDRPRPGAQR